MTKHTSRRPSQRRTHTNDTIPSSIRFFGSCVLLLVIGIIFFMYWAPTQTKISDIETSTIIDKNQPQTTITDSQEQKSDFDLKNQPLAPSQAIPMSIFIPYWNIPDEGTAPTTPSLPQNDHLYSIYFGLSPDKGGTLQEDSGSSSLKNFVALNHTKPTLLTIRMLQEDVNQYYFDNPEETTALFKEVERVAKANNFSGVILDLEQSSFATADLVDKIRAFIQLYSDALGSSDLEIYITLYGDTYYRGRPYDVPTIQKYVDGIFIMAYDFHKSFGTPGPNFPVSGYDYNFIRMLKDFTNDVPANKLHIVYGMYGYEWLVDAKNRPLKSATAVTRAQARKNYETQNCACTLVRDEESSEIHVTFKDSEGYTHSIWYEDEESITRKTAIAETFGITQGAIWAYGYY